MRIGIVAGEVSGDILGAGLIKALQQRIPDAEFIGIGGPRMMAVGCQSLFPMEKLSLMGLFEVLAHLPEVLAIRRQVKKVFLDNPPDLFIGIDAPDFNLSLELALRNTGIKTVHYVSPTVWAWRQYRVKKIEKAVDLILSIFPFEVDFYRQHQVPVRFVGHPLADHFPLTPDRAAARVRLNLDPGLKVIALLPGSRTTELKYLAPLFVEVAAWILNREPGVRFLVPLANARTREMFVQAMGSSEIDLPITLLDGESHAAMEAADAVLCASGTATLEALLLKRPMVVAYRMAAMTFGIMRRMLKIPRYSMPNLMSGKALVAEFIQDEAKVEPIGEALLKLLADKKQVDRLTQEFEKIHYELRLNASERAAEAVLSLLESKL